MNKTEIHVREGRRDDLPRILELIKELAAYEKALDEVTNTVDQMALDGFGPNPIYGFFVAEVNHHIVGMALFYWRYSTWKGKRLYLEDIIVTEAHRGKGIGKMLFEATMRHALQQNCTGMMWQVLDWNAPAIRFYTKYYGARMDNGWINCHLEKADMMRLLGLEP